MIQPIFDNISILYRFPTPSCKRFFLYDIDTTKKSMNDIDTTQVEWLPIDNNSMYHLFLSLGMPYSDILTIALIYNHAEWCNKFDYTEDSLVNAMSMVCNHLHRQKYKEKVLEWFDILKKKQYNIFKVEGFLSVEKMNLLKLLHSIDKEYVKSNVDIGILGKDLVHIYSNKKMRSFFIRNHLLEISLYTSETLLAAEFCSKRDIKKILQNSVTNIDSYSLECLLWTVITHKQGSLLNIDVKNKLSYLYYVAQKLLKEKHNLP